MFVVLLDFGPVLTRFSLIMFTIFVKALLPFAPRLHPSHGMPPSGRADRSQTRANDDFLHGGWAEGGRYVLLPRLRGDRRIENDRSVVWMSVAPLGAYHVMGCGVRANSEPGTCVWIMGAHLIKEIPKKSGGFIAIIQQAFLKIKDTV